MEPRHSAIGAAGRADELFVADLEFFHFPLGVGVCLRDPDTGNAAFNGRIDGGIALSAIIKSLAHSLAGIERHHHKDRHAGKNDQGQNGINA